MIKLIGILVLGFPLSIFLGALIHVLFKTPKEDIKNLVLFFYIIFVGVTLIIYG